MKQASAVSVSGQCWKDVFEGSTTQASVSSNGAIQAAAVKSVKQTSNLIAV